MNAFPLILIHGYPFDRTLWLSTIASLGTAAKVFAPDLAGFGRNPLPRDAKPTLEFLAEQVVRGMDDWHSEKIVCVGMSMGGYVALALAEKYPDRIAGFGLVSSQSSADLPEARKARQEMIQKIRRGGAAVAAEGILPKLFAGEKPKNPELARYATEGAEQAGVDGLCFALEAMAGRPDRTALLTQMKVPVLIAHGLEDRIVPPSRARQMAEHCQKPILVEIRGAGHATPLEAPDHVAAGLSRLMRAVREEQTVPQA